MNGYFKPLKRKVGVATLVIACLFAAGWIRCQIYNDSIGFSFDDTEGFDAYSFTSERLEDSYCSVGYYFNRFTPASGNPISYEFSMEKQSEDPPMNFGTDVNWLISSYGFRIGRAPEKQPRPNQQLTIIQFSARLVPYWSVVLPLTALSAWLLLSKRRKAKAI